MCHLASSLPPRIQGGANWAIVAMQNVCKRNVQVAPGNPIILTMGEAALIAHGLPKHTRASSYLLQSLIIFYIENSCHSFKKQHRNM